MARMGRATVRVCPDWPRNLFSRPGHARPPDGPDPALLRGRRGNLAGIWYPRRTRVAPIPGLSLGGGRRRGGGADLLRDSACYAKISYFRAIRFLAARVGRP